MWFFLALGSAVFASLVAIFGKLGLGKIDSTVATTIRSIIMASFLVIVTLALGKFRHLSPSSFSHREWVFIVLAGVAGALSWLFYFAALRTGLASRVAAVDRLSVVFVLIFSIAFLGETLRWKSVIAALLIAAGAILMTLAK